MVILSNQFAMQLETVRLVLKPLAGVGVVLVFFLAFYSWAALLVFSSHKQVCLPVASGGMLA